MSEKADMLEVLRAENARLLRWVQDLQSGMYINCVYCGHRYGPKDEVPVSMAEVLKQHVAHCPEHPMSQCVKQLQAASHALRSYESGNASPALAGECANAIDALVADVTGESCQPSKADKAEDRADKYLLPSHHVLLQPGSTKTLCAAGGGCKKRVRWALNDEGVYTFYCGEHKPKGVEVRDWFAGNPKQPRSKNPKVGG